MGTYEERHTRGLDVMRTLSGGAYEPERGAKSMVNRNGALGSFGNDYILGDLWSRPQLSRRDRSMIVITFLCVLGSTEELEAHVRGGLNHGLSREEIDEIVLQVAGYAGFPMAMRASRVVDGVFNEIDGVERRPKRQPAASLDDETRRANANEVRMKLFDGRPSPDPEIDRAGVVGIIGGVGELAYDWAFRRAVGTRGAVSPRPVHGHLRHLGDAVPQ